MSKPDKIKLLFISLTPGTSARFEINSVIFFTCNLFCLLLSCCFDVQTGSKVVCFVFSEYRRCSRSSSKCFLCSASCCHRNQT